MPLSCHTFEIEQVSSFCVDPKTNITVNLRRLLCFSRAFSASSMILNNSFKYSPTELQKTFGISPSYRDAFNTVFVSCVFIFSIVSPWRLQIRHDVQEDADQQGRLVQRWFSSCLFLGSTEHVKVDHIFGERGLLFNEGSVPCKIWKRVHEGFNDFATHAQLN